MNHLVQKKTKKNEKQETEEGFGVSSGKYLENGMKSDEKIFAVLYTFFMVEKIIYCHHYFYFTLNYTSLPLFECVENHGNNLMWFSLAKRLKQTVICFLFVYDFTKLNCTKHTSHWKGKTFASMNSIFFFRQSRYASRET